MKTNRSIAKRFRKTASGKLKRAQGNKSHLLSKKSSKRKARLGKTVYLAKTMSAKMNQVL